MLTFIAIAGSLRAITRAQPPSMTATDAVSPDWATRASSVGSNRWPRPACRNAALAIENALSVRR